MSTMLTTTAYHLDQLGRGLDGMALRESTVPQPGPREVLIGVRAAALNRRDLMILDKKYPLPATPGVVPLADGAGEVVAVGADVTRVNVGDRVSVTYFRRWINGPMTLALTSEQTGCNFDGTLAEYQIANEEAVVRIPENLSFEEAATLPTAGVLAWSALTPADRPLTAGETVLTVGTGTVALMALQLASALGAEVIAVTGGADNAAKLTALGAAHVIDRRSTPDWETIAGELTGGRGVDHVIDAVGPATLERSIKAAGFNGQVALIGAFSAGGAQLDPDLFNGRFVTVRKFAVGHRHSFEALVAFIEKKATRPVIDSVFDYADAKAAYTHFAEGGPFGKVVIRIPH